MIPGSRYSGSKFAKLFERPIAFQRAFATIGGCALSGLMLSQAYYWATTLKNENGWFYKTAIEWEDETALTSSQQRTARKKLRDVGVLEEVAQGLPRKLYFRLNFSRFDHLIDRLLEQSEKGCNLRGSQFAKSAALEMSFPQARTPDVTSSVAKSAEQSIYTEITPESTCIDSPQTPLGGAKKKGKGKEDDLGVKRGDEPAKAELIDVELAEVEIVSQEQESNSHSGKKNHLSQEAQLPRRENHSQITKINESSPNPKEYIIPGTEEWLELSAIAKKREIDRVIKSGKQPWKRNGEWLKEVISAKANESSKSRKYFTTDLGTLNESHLIRHLTKMENEARAFDIESSISSYVSLWGIYQNAFLKAVPEAKQAIKKAEAKKSLEENEAFAYLKSIGVYTDEEFQ